MTAIGHLLNHPAAGFVVRTLHLVEFLVLPGINLEKRLDVHPPTWSIRLQWLAALWAAIINAGMDSGRLESIELLQARIQDSITLVTIEGRTLGLPNVMQNPVTEDSWWVHISPRRLGAGDGTNVVLSQMRNMVTGHWGPNSHEEFLFESALYTLVPTAFTTRSASAQAAGVIAHLRRTVVRPGLDTFVCVDCANFEVGRRLQDTSEAALITLFERS